MVYLDTNVFIYASVEQSIEKKKTALKIIRSLIEKSELKISTLVIQEMIFTLGKLGISSETINSDIKFYLKFLEYEVSADTLRDAIDLSFKVQGFKSINDLIHLKIAEKFCEKIVSFDRDFAKFKKHCKIPVEILS